MHFGQYIRQHWKALKYDVGGIDFEKGDTNSRRKVKCYIQQNERRLTGIVTTCIGTSF
jgi:hypothetical protein